MKTTGVRYLLPSLLLFLGALALSSWAWVISDKKAGAVRQEKESLETARATARSRLMQSGAEKNIILAHLEAYEQLEKRGVAVGGNRLAWLEAVQKSNASARLYGLQYTLEPASAMPGSAEMEQTSMKLRMPLMTEDDLLLFLNNLASSGTGLFQTKSCTLSRTGNMQPEMLNQPGLEAECELLWYSAKKPETRS
jgi:hypothetical protein